MKPRKDTDGYLLVNLSLGGAKTTFKLHRLVAEAYIPNPDKKETVNHKDENKENNCVSNLEWMTRTENINYGTHHKRVGEAHRKAVYCLELNKEFESITIAAQETGARLSGISACCTGRIKTTSGYHWRYVE